MAFKNYLIQNSSAKKVMAKGFTSQQISVYGAVFALLAAVSVWTAFNTRLSVWILILFLLLALIGIVLRLVCHKLNGLMMSEEQSGRQKSRLTQEVAERFSDAVILLGISSASHLEWVGLIGWVAVLFTLSSSSIRHLGELLTGKNEFLGILSKDHRMFLCAFACLASIAEIFGLWMNGLAFFVVLSIIALGSLITSFQRLSRIYQQINS